MPSSSIIFSVFFSISSPPLTAVTVVVLNVIGTMLNGLLSVNLRANFGDAGALAPTSATPSIVRGVGKM
jgi:hypothetical protein